MPKSQKQRIEEGGIVRFLGCLLPDEYPVAMTAAAAGMRVFTEAEIRDILDLPDGRTLHGSRELFDDSWILDQHQTSGCNGNSTASALSKRLFIDGNRKELLSGGDCYSQMNQGVDNGSSLQAGIRVVANGIAPLRLVSNTTIFDRQISAAAKAERSKYRGREPLAVDSELELATALIVNKLAIIAVQAGGKFSQRDEHGVSRGGNGPGNHSVHLDDLRLRAGAIEFRMVNSWSATWGDHGTIWLQWDRHLRETVTHHRFWTLPTSAVNPDHKPPELKT